MTKRPGIGLLMLSVMLISLLALAAPAMAHHKDGHDKGKSSDSGTTTEDTDTNDPDPENKADAGDNKHPSGKDRSVENSPSSNPNNGKSESDPDGNSNGGKDKPGGSGGDDLADQDGNNGCGNDDDFEDDNNGNCGGKKKPSQATVKGHEVKKGRHEAKKDHEVKKGHDEVQPAGEDVLGNVNSESVSAPALPVSTPPLADVFVGPASDRPAADVLGSRIRRGNRVAPAVVRGARVRGRVLPFTGSDPMSLILIALGLVGTGYLMLRRVRA